MGLTTVLITGSKSGIGKGLLSVYAARPNTLAIAAIRDGPDSEAANVLTSLPVGAGSKVIVAKYDAASTTSAQELVSYLQSQHSIQYLDIVVANAGILKHSGPVKDASAELLNEHFRVNSLGPILLYQAVYPLLRAAKEPKYFIISSAVGSMGIMEHYTFPFLAYGMSKAAVNYFAKKAHLEDDKITVVPFQPGWVQTNMGHKAAELAGLDTSDVPVTLEQSVSGLIKLFDAATKSGMSGTFQDAIGGKSVPW